MAGRIGFDFEVALGRKRERSRPDEEAAMRILLMGDFSGRSSRGVEAHHDLATRKPLPIDIDNFERVLGRIAPRLELTTQAADRITLDFATLEDFHPDRLYRRVSVFDRLRELRDRMRNPATFAAAAVEFGARGGESDADTLSRLVGMQTVAPVPTSAEQASLDALIAKAVAPHIVPDAPHQALYVAQLDAAIGDEMRAILQHAQFKALEALWRGAHWLVSNLDTDGPLKLYLLDVSRDELLVDMQGARGSVESCALYRLLAEEAKDEAGGEPWSIIASDLAFGLGGEDVELLAFLGAIASRAGGPFLAAAKPEVIGCASLAAAPDPRDWTAPQGDAAARWQALRESGVAPWIGLALPRVLLRLPYGRSGEPIESFPFEELAGGREHETYLWGSGALAGTLLIARAFNARGWDMEPGDELEIDDLPAYVYEEDGEKRLQPCAEAPLGDRAGEAILEAGPMPLLSYKNRNAVRVMRFQSIATPARALHGPWR